MGMHAGCRYPAHTSHRHPTASTTRQVGCNFGIPPPSTSTDLRACMVERNADTAAARATALYDDAIVDGNSSGGVGGRKNNSFHGMTRQVG